MTASNTPKGEEKSKLQLLRERKAEREEKAAKDFEALEVEALELEEKYELAGQRLDRDFAIVTTLAGNFAVRKPDFLVAKKFSEEEKKTIESVVQFVAPCVLFPEQMAAREVFQSHGGVAWVLAKALIKLYEADAGGRVGKS